MFDRYSSPHNETVIRLLHRPVAAWLQIFLNESIFDTHNLGTYNLYTQTFEKASLISTVLEEMHTKIYF